ncbi:DNA adenine methylase [Chitinimonas koreensis]|uniref:DNA adenine methylase n=1 Tax=Chitinimonas koreensis TaxID=356302 RepID=UPI000429A707|nr:DNA adenine methylase [Chitinimonas koreensis]
MRYPGGKGGSGVYQTIINLMPAHDRYIETHVGGGNVLERKRPARSSIAIDIDPAVAEHWRRQALPGVTVVNGDAVAWLANQTFTGTELVYSDPPYLMETRRSGPLYRHEYTVEDHVALLDALKRLPCPVMLSGYRSELYDDTLAGWRSVDFQAMTRRGPAIETVWMNYHPPKVLHESTYVGRDFRERERIKRRRQRWRERLLRLDLAERQALLDELRELLADGGHDRTELIAAAGTVLPAGSPFAAMPDLVGNSDGRPHTLDLFAIADAAAGGIAISGEPGQTLTCDRSSLAEGQCNQQLATS